MSRFVDESRNIALEGVTVQYYDGHRIITALNDIHFSVGQGQRIGVLGTKESGKSTLIRLLSKMQRPMVGHIAHDLSVSWPLWAKTGLIKSLTVRDNIRFVAQLYGLDPPDVIRRVDDLVALGSNMDLELGELPPNMTAKIMFATAVSLDFECYPMDDWAMSSDPAFRRKAEDVLHEVSQRAAIVMATSKAKFVREYCDVAYVLHAGVLTPYDSIDEAIDAFRAYS